MQRDVDLETIERDARRTFRQDGLDIIFLGMALALAAVFFIDIRHGWVFGMAVLLYAQGPDIARKRIIQPRIGFAKFRPVIRGALYHVVSAAAAVTGIIALYVLGKHVQYNWLMPLYLGFVFALVYFLIAHVNRTPIDYLLSVLFILSGIIGVAYTRRGIDSGMVAALQLWGLAVVLVVVGIAMLVRFLNKYPIHNDDVPDENAY